MLEEEQKGSKTKDGFPCLCEKGSRCINRAPVTGGRPVIEEVDWDDY